MREANEQPSSSAELYGGGESRGAGGKLRRERNRPPSTPYDRPPQPQPQPPANNRGWISKIVTPAKRLISGSATRLLPSLLAAPPLPEPPSPADERPTEVEQETPDCNASCSVDARLLVAPKSSSDLGPSEAEGQAKIHNSDKDKHVHLRDPSDDQLPDIEQLIKRKTFSRGEIDRLMEVLHSRFIDEELERQHCAVSGPGKAEKPESSHGKQNTAIDKEQPDKFEWTATPPPRSTVPGEIGASPVDIARAYMGSRTSDVGFTSMSLTSRSEKFPLPNELPSKTFMPSPLPKAPVCWPGAITQDQQGFSTPQSQKGRYGFQSFPRTPYSRTLYAKSKSKVTPLQGDSEKMLNISPVQAMRTPVYGKSMNNVAEGSHASGGPIRRMRNKYSSTTPARDSTLSQSVQRSPWTKDSNAGPMVKKNFDPNISSFHMEPILSKQQNSEVGVPSAHPHSSKLARQILEQIDRPITLKEKSEELMLVASWKNSSKAALAAPIQNSSSPSTSEAGASKEMFVDAAKLAGQTNGGNNALPLDQSNVISGSGKGVASAFPISLDKTSNISGMSFGPQSSVQKFDSHMKSTYEANNDNLTKKNGQSWLTGDQSKAVHITNNSSGSEPQNVQRRPVLPSISVDKSGIRNAFTSDTSTGFSFPVTRSSSTSMEPPTPSIMPSTSMIPAEQPKVPAQSSTFTFGSKITIAPPVVPIPPPSTVSTLNGASAPKFKFGSGQTRLSFALAGNDAASAPNDAVMPKYKFGSGKSRLNFGSVGSDAVRC